MESREVTGKSQSKGIELLQDTNEYSELMDSHLVDCPHFSKQVHEDINQFVRSRRALFDFRGDLTELEILAEKQELEKQYHANEYFQLIADELHGRGEPVDLLHILKQIHEDAAFRGGDCLVLDWRRLVLKLKKTIYKEYQQDMIGTSADKRPGFTALIGHFYWKGLKLEPLWIPVQSLRSVMFTTVGLVVLGMGFRAFRHISIDDISQELGISILSSEVLLGIVAAYLLVGIPLYILYELATNPMAKELFESKITQKKRLGR